MTKQSNREKLKKGNLNWALFHTRAGIIRTIRRFFESQDFLEVEPPLLTPHPTLDRHIHSMRTSFQEERGKPHRLFLHTSPEHAMKKLLAAGAKRIFFLGKVFRDGELTRLHNPEFTMLEWYRTDATYDDIMADTEKLIACVMETCFSDTTLIYQGERIDLTHPYERTSMQALFKQEVGIDLNACLTTEKLRMSAVNQGFYIQEKDDWETIFFRIFLEKIEPKLGLTKPLFVMDYPVRMGMMAKKKVSDPDWVERVELYIGGLELTNGYSELTDPDEQQVRFEQEKKIKMEKGQSDHPIDTELLSALRKGISPAAGMALGVDRLVMLMTNQIHIRNVILFPMHQWMDK